MRRRKHCARDHPHLLSGLQSGSRKFPDRSRVEIRQGMSNVNSIRIWDVEADAITGVFLDDAVQRIATGDILLVRRGLQRAGLWEEIELTLWEAIAEALGQDRMACLRKTGLGSMHLLLTGEQIKRCNEAAHRRFNSIARSYVPKLVRDVVGYRGPGFYDQNSVIRFYVPVGFHRANREVLETRPGYTKPQGPHVDTWFGHATSGLNLWMAIGPVRRGNGLALFPQKWLGQIPHDGQYRPVAGQHFGSPVTFDMDPGDLLFFHGEHLHSSELNSTSQTRVALTNRFSLSSPRVVSETTTAQWLELPASNPAQKTMQVADMARSYSVEEFRGNYTSTSGEGTIIPLNDRWCRVTICGVRRIVSRICPHEGGDLSEGYVQNGRIHCPWHHMSFDPATGQAACDGIASLRIGPAEP